MLGGVGLILADRYIVFVWVINNALIIQYGALITTSTVLGKSVNLPITYTTSYGIVLGSVNCHYAYMPSIYQDGDTGYQKTLSSFVISSTAHATGSNKGCYWITMGY